MFRCLKRRNKKILGKSGLFSPLNQLFNISAMNCAQLKFVKALFFNNFTSPEKRKYGMSCLSFSLNFDHLTESSQGVKGVMIYV